MTSTNASLGYGYFFVVVPRTWLHGKYIRFNWEGYISAGTGTSIRVLIYDGSYDRSSDTDFPNGSDIPNKGNGSLQVLVSKTATFANETQDVQADVDGGTQETCTIFFCIYDGNNARNYWEQMDWFEINQNANGSGNLVSEHFTDSVTMERTGGTGDYGYISTGEISFAVISGVTRDYLGNVLGTCTVWLFRTNDKYYMGVTVSDANGVYSFNVIDTSTEYFVRAYKDGTPNVFGTTDDDLVGVSP
jgi:hypothetical protein